tara:strand:- start:154 stop:1032 length:879 start_codon:yes stop_codon:yes gene_type:complete
MSGQYITIPSHLALAPEECNKGGADEVDAFYRAYAVRKIGYDVPIPESNTEGVTEVRENGYTILRNVFDKELLLKLKNEMEDCISEGGDNLNIDDNYYATVEQPMLRCPSAVQIAFSDLVRDFSTEYFEVQPAIGTFNLRKSRVNGSDAHGFSNHGNLFYHYDNNSPHFLKFFFYLNDVDQNGGPFTYVAGSHKEKFSGWKMNKRFSDEQIEGVYGKERIKHLTASLGDVIVANTRGIHKGTKAVDKERNMYTVDVVIHPENWQRPNFKMLQDDFDSLKDEVKPFADFLVKV